MNVTQQGIEDHQTILQIEVEPERVQRAMQQAARKLSQRYRIPGFRPGKAPYNIVLQMLGKDQVFDAALDDLGGQVYKEAVEQAALDPFAPGRIEVVTREPLTIKALVPLKPDVDPGDYKNVRVVIDDPEVTEDDVEEIVENLQAEQATWTPVERPAQLEDRVTMHANGTVDGEQMFHVHDEEVWLVEDNFKEFPAGFLDEVVGMSSGDSREFDLTYPEDAEHEALRGKTAHFEVEIRDVKERELSELDDEFAAGLGLGGVSTLDELRERIRINEGVRRARDARDQLEDKVLTAVAEQAVIKYPPIMVAAELEDEMERQAETMQRMGFTLENYLRFTNMTPDQFRAQLAPTVERRIQRSLLMDAIAKREEVEAPEGTPEEQAANARLRTALNWLVETVSGKPADWPNITALTGLSEDEIQAMADEGEMEDEEEWEDTEEWEGEEEGEEGEEGEDGDDAPTAPSATTEFKEA
ncbi:MAG: trigger factor [Anaerolineae bacterium]|nr:trigger factor [Anaerolineae bacterium]